MIGQKNLMHSKAQVLLGSALALLVSTAVGEEATPAEAPVSDFWTRKYMLGDWGGARTELANQGINFRLDYTSYTYVNMSGGRDTENGHDFAGVYDLTLLLEFEKMGVAPGLEYFIRSYGHFGGGPGDFDRDKIGGLHRTIGAVGPCEPIAVDRWWFRQRLFDNNIEMHLGKLTDIVDKSPYADSDKTQFSNKALDGNRVIPGTNALGFSLRVWLNDFTYITGGVVDDARHPRTLSFVTPFQAEDHFKVLWEIATLPRFQTNKGILPGSYRAGGWFDPGSRPVYFDNLGGRLAPRTRGDDVGLFLGFDQFVWKENDNPKDKQGFAVFGKYGYAHGDINFIEHYWAVGCQYQGLIPDRDADVLGFGVAQSVISSDYRREIDGTFDRETAYELYYRMKLTQWLSLISDLQFVNQPGGNQDSRDAFVAGLRLRVNF
jgi:porin